jgi:hypothetical protein
MKKLIKRTLLFGFVWALFLSVALSAAPAQAQTDKRQPQQKQPTVVVKPNPQNPQVKIIELPADRRSVVTMRSQRNVLDSSEVKLTPIPFQRFEMVHPSTGKALNPNAELRLPAAEPGGRQRVTTVKQFYDELNAFEQELAKRGRSLRQLDTFKGLKPKYNAQDTSATNVGQSPLTVTPFEVDTTLYVSANTPDEGNQEFPAKWVKQATKTMGNKKFAFLIETYKANTSLIKKVDWQLSTSSSFTKKWTGVAATTVWSLDHLGLGSLKTKGNSYNSFVIDFGAIPDFYPDKNGPVNYFIRVIPYYADGTPMKPSTIAVAGYGAEAEFIEVASKITDKGENLYLDFPPDSISPFGVYMQGHGFTMVKAQKTTKTGMKTLGFSAFAGAEIGLRYFNFLSLVDDKEPKNKKLDVLGLDFSAATGSEAAAGAPPAKLTIKLLGESHDVPLESTPGGALSLGHTFKQPINKKVIDQWFSIGPVPIHIDAEVTGEVGVELKGTVDPKALQLNGSIHPYVHTAFAGRGGVDAVIAYAKLQAQFNPLFSADFYVDFNSNNSDLLTMTKDINYLKGNVSLVAGFYYPCPSLKKFVGFITGDEPLPLCEQKWEYQIFPFNK